MESNRRESEKDWMIVKFKPKDLDYFSSRLKAGKPLNYILTSNYEINVTDQSHRYFKEKNSLQDDEILDEGSFNLSFGKIRTSNFPHNRTDRMLSPIVQEKLNDTFSL